MAQQKRGKPYVMVEIVENTIMHARYSSEGEFLDRKPAPIKAQAAFIARRRAAKSKRRRKIPSGILGRSAA